jgi:MraZ protein
VYYAAIDGAPDDYLDEINRKIESLPPFSQERDDLIDSIMPFIERLACDSEGRVVLPEKLIEHAGLSDSAAFVGRGQNFQIWHPEALRARQAEARARTRALRPAASGRPTDGQAGPLPTTGDRS